MRARSCWRAFWAGLGAWDGPPLPAGVLGPPFVAWWRLGRAVGVLGAAGLCLATLGIVWGLAMLAEGGL